MNYESLAIDDDSDAGGYLDARPLSYDDTEREQKAKKRYIKKINKQPLPPPLFIDDKDTVPRPFRFPDSEEARERKLNFQKKYPIRKKMKVPKYIF